VKTRLILGYAALGLTTCALGQSRPASNLPDTPPATVARDGASDQKPTGQKPTPTAAKTNADRTLFSQTSSNKPNRPAITIKRNVNEVNVVFTVTDKHGRFVKDLKKGDFKVLDDNKSQQILSFRSETDLPLRVGLVIDISDSIRERFTFEQEAAIEFLTQIIRQNTDKAFVVGFNTVAEVTQDYTDNTEELARGVRILRPGGSTALYDAIYYSCLERLMNPLTSLEDTRRAIILLSDGDDNQSRFTRQDAIEMAQRASVIIYAISTNTTGEKTRGDNILEQFAQTTGGRVFTASKPQELRAAFTDIQTELRSQYAISYHPSNFAQDGSYRTIDIKAMGKKDLKVRAKKGYYAPKAIAAQSQQPGTSLSNEQ
jgi:VWFA-related protein